MTFASSSRNIPCKSLLCDSLHVDMSWSQLLHVHTDAIAQVKHLVTTANVPAAIELDAFADLRHHTQLKSLKVLSKDFAAEFKNTDAVMHSMRQCPATLEQLAIDGQDFCYLNNVAPSLEYVLGTTLAHLTCLELTDAYLVLDKGSLACFTHLRSLNLGDSQVHAAVDDAANLTWLSGLTTLNLTGSTWFDLKTSAAGNVEDQPCAAAFTSFHGWPAMEVLKSNSCNLFGPLTALHIPEVQDVQVYHRNHVTDSKRVRVHRHCSDFDEAMSFSYLPHCACSIVELRVVCLPVMRSGAVVQGMQHLLSSCQSLQVLDLGNSGGEKHYHSYEQADLVLQDQQAVSLQELRLHHFCFTKIDLRRAGSLTSIVLECADNLWHADDCELFLPHRLHFFEFRGRALFAPISKFKLERCDSLVKLVIKPSSVYSNYAYNIPVLPSSLHHLKFGQSRGEDTWVNGRDWQCLNGCTNLERLTLPSKQYLTPWIRKWIKSARHLHIVAKIGIVQDVDYTETACKLN